MSEASGVVSVSRRIEAPAERIFALLADPSRHTDFDGSEMLRGPEGGGSLSGVGDRFVMRMYFDGMGGDYAMDNHVVEYDAPRRIAWTPSAADERVTSRAGGEVGVPAGHRWSFDLQPDGPDATVVTETYDCTKAPDELRQAVQQGELWRDAMTATLERLEAAVSA